MNVVNANLQWCNELTPLNPSEVQYIVIHHAEAVNASPEDIHRWHLENGWSGAGYNEYIRKDGIVYILRGDNVGAHCLGFNEVGYGICCEGDYDTETNMPVDQYDALVERIKYNASRFNAKVVGHKDLMATACPGRYFPLQNLYEIGSGITMSENYDIAEVQTQLNKLGYNLTADGVVGPCTLDALHDFKGKHGLEVNDYIDRFTVEAIYAAVAALNASVPVPQPAPTQPHWAEKFYDDLTAKGIKISKKDFDKPITRGEVFNLLAQVMGYKI